MLFIFSYFSFCQYIEITDSNVGTIIGGKLPSIIKFYLTDCIFCQELAPEFQEAADMFSNQEIIFGGVNCDEHKNICEKFNVDGYPRIYFFKQNSKEEGVRFTDERTSNSIADFIEEKTNIKARRPPKALINISPDDFDTFKIKSQCAFMAFYDISKKTCKRFVPQLQQAAFIYQSEPNVTIGSVNCRRYADLCASQDIEELPTIKFFLNGNLVEYTNPLNLRGIINFLNQKCGTERDMDGLLNDTAGLIPEANEIVKEFLIASDKIGCIEKMKKVKGTEFYVKVMERFLLKGIEQVEKDLKKMGQLLDERKGSIQALDQMKKRYNVFLLFVPQKNEDL
ncbi:hypothetical protein M9Y10_000769 [Tritrichomonas musculus]|uniref:protein disulfide-isomerase n=1 Tax=Tritrichomonas musculus TaxID=1915356 RepID=A0ABR2L544_9EUKA